MLALLAAIALPGCGPKVARFSIFVTGDTMGYLENCGCVAAQAGGVHRRARVLGNQIELARKAIPGDHGRPVATFLVDAGDFADAGDPVRRLLSKGVVRAMGVMKYDAAGIGLNELSFPQSELLDLLDEANPSFPYVAANLEISKPDAGPDCSSQLRELIKPFVVLKGAGGYRVGLIHVMDDTTVNSGRVLASGFGVTSPIPAITRILDNHYSEADIWMLTVSDLAAHGLRADDVAKLTRLTLVVNMASRNPLEGEGSTEALLPVFIERLSEKGKDLAEIDGTLLKGGRVRILGTKYGVKESYKPDPAVQAVIDQLKPDLEALEMQIATDALNKQKTAVFRPVYLGYQACYGCHKPIVEQMMATRHMHAYDTLQRIGKQHMECAKCHNVGFNLPGGWNVLEDKQAGTAFFDKRNVQCENCHGPGDYHVLAVKGEDVPKDFRAGGRDEHGLQPVSEKTCIQCHFGENDPHFNFSTYWKKIAHGMDGPLPITEAEGEAEVSAPHFSPDRGFRQLPGDGG